MKIAPTLTMVVRRDHSGPYLFVGDSEDGPQALRELDALLAVARAADRFFRAKHAPGAYEAATRALARLHKLGKGTP